MKNPHAQGDPWNRSPDKEPVVTSASGSNKTFKRKSREPKRLLSRPEQAFMSDDDSSQAEPGRLTPVHGPVMSQEVRASSAGMAPAQSGAIDMRIGVSVPTITSKLSKIPGPPLADREISHWPIAISQPLSNRLKLGLCPSLPLTLPTSLSHSPSHQFFPLESSLSGQAAPLPGPRASQSLLCQEHDEPQALSPKESPRKRPVLGVDGSGCVPEVKAIQQNRRLLANARERTRVHTISAAFEALRKQVPCYSYGQKLSKLAILRIACNYILSLAQLAELDYSPEHGSVTFSQCVEQCTRTLQAEGRSKKRKVARMPEDL